MRHVEKALTFVRDGMSIGLGTGHAAEAFLHALGDRVKQGLRIRGVPTSKRTEELARQIGVPLVDLEHAVPLDLAVDGADEVDADLNLIKGYGHAFLREKVVALAARTFIVLIGPDLVREKLVKKLGERGKLPIEVVPFALPFVSSCLANMGLPAEPVRVDESMLVTDNGNHILECRVASARTLRYPFSLEQRLHAIPGVVETGLFLRMADLVLVQDGETLRELRQT